MILPFVIVAVLDAVWLLLYLYWRNMLSLRLLQLLLAIFVLFFYPSLLSFVEFVVVVVFDVVDVVDDDAVVVLVVEFLQK